MSQAPSKWWDLLWARRRKDVLTDWVFAEFVGDPDGFGVAVDQVFNVDWDGVVGTDHVYN